jgi:hypothetical protein
VPSWKRLDIKGVIGIEQLVREHTEEIEPGLRIIDSRTLFGNATIDLVGLDSKESLALIALSTSADEAMLLRLLEASSWCLANPEILHRLYPMAPSRPGWSPRVFCVAERIPEAFIRTVKHCGFPRIDCVRLIHLELDGTKGVYFEPVAPSGDRPAESPEDPTDRPGFSQVIKFPPPIESPATFSDRRAGRLALSPEDALPRERGPTGEKAVGATGTPLAAPQVTARAQAPTRDGREADSERRYLFAGVVNLPELTRERHPREEESSTPVTVIDGGRSYLFAEAVKLPGPTRGDGIALDLPTPFDDEPRSPVPEEEAQGESARSYLFAGAVTLAEVSGPDRVALTTPPLDVIEAPGTDPVQEAHQRTSERNYFAEAIRLPVPETRPITSLAGRLGGLEKGWQEALARLCEPEPPIEAKTPTTESAIEPPRANPNATRFAEFKQGWQEALAHLCDSEPPGAEIKLPAAAPSRALPDNGETRRAIPEARCPDQVKKARPESRPSREENKSARTGKRTVPGNPAPPAVDKVSPMIPSGERLNQARENEIQPVVEIVIEDDVDVAAQTTGDLPASPWNASETPSFPKWANANASHTSNIQPGTPGTNSIPPEAAEPLDKEEIKRYREKWGNLLNNLGGLRLPEGTLLSRQWRDFLDSLEATNLERRKQIRAV